MPRIQPNKKALVLSEEEKKAEQAWEWVSSEQKAEAHLWKAASGQAEQGGNQSKGEEKAGPAASFSMLTESAAVTTLADPQIRSEERLGSMSLGTARTENQTEDVTSGIVKKSTIGKTVRRAMSGHHR